ncbi:hypothetical protein K488DRAFT_75421, partial [Vararia minispora EC-137]
LWGPIDSRPALPLPPPYPNHLTNRTVLRNTRQTSLRAWLRKTVPTYPNRLQAYNLPPKKLFRKKPKYTVTVDSGIGRAKTGVAKGESPVWTDDLVVELTAGGKLSIIISKKRLLGGFKDIGICKRAYDDVVKELSPIPASSESSLVKWPVQSLLGTEKKSQNMWLGFSLTSEKPEDERQRDPNAKTTEAVPGPAEVRVGSSHRVDGSDIPSARDLVDQVATIAGAPSSQPALRS